MIIRMDETERLIRNIESSGWLDASIAGFALLEAGGEAALAQAWADEVEPIRGRLPSWVMSDLSDLLLERLKACDRGNWPATIPASGTN